MCLAKWSALKQTKQSCSGNTRSETANREQISLNREYLKMLIDIVLYLSCRFSNLSSIYIEKEISNNINSKDILLFCIFVKANNRKIYTKINNIVNILNIKIIKTLINK